VQFDAHIDTWDEYFGGKYFHGTPFRRAIEEGVLDPKRTVQIGIRGSLYKRDDNDWAIAQGMRVITIEEYFDLGVEKGLDLLPELFDVGIVELTAERAIVILDAALGDHSWFERVSAVPASSRTMT